MNVIRYPDLAFSANWNGKLQCQAYTSIRAHNPKLHFVGQRFRAFLCEDGRTRGLLHVAEVVAHRTFRLQDLKPEMAWLDTGHCLEDTRKIICDIYKKYGDPSERLYSWMLLRKLDIDPTTLNY